MDLPVLYVKAHGQTREMVLLVKCCVKFYEDSKNLMIWIKCNNGKQP